MNSGDIAIIIVAIISLASAAFTASSARKAAITGERVKAEAEAYTRSRDTYLATIKHQDNEIAELREEVVSIRRNNKLLQQENIELRRRIELLEQH